MNRVLAILVLAGFVQLQEVAGNTVKPTIIDGRAPSTVVPSGITNADTLCRTDDKLGLGDTENLCNTGNTNIRRNERDTVDFGSRDGSGKTSEPETEKPKREGCGWLNPNGVGFESNDMAKFGEFPWAVAILKVERLFDNDPDSMKINVYIGGGSLIHPSVVLTAAHHAVNARELKARAGEWDTQTTKEIYPHQDRYVESFVVHKEFNKGNMLYDAALLFLKSPFEMAPNVGVACLPPPEEPAKASTHCFATGWGKLGMKQYYSTILKKMEATVVDHKTCQDILQTTTLGPLFQLDASLMCTGAKPGKSTCKGDEGAPLVCPIEFGKDRYVQNGIYVWGIDCGEMGTPGVYVDVSKVRIWIDEKVIEKGYQPVVYQNV